MGRNHRGHFLLNFTEYIMIVRRSAPPFVQIKLFPWIKRWLRTQKDVAGYSTSTIPGMNANQARTVPPLTLKSHTGVENDHRDSPMTFLLMERGLIKIRASENGVFSFIMYIVPTNSDYEVRALRSRK